MEKRFYIVRNWPEELVKGNGKPIAKKLQSFTSAEEIINWSVKQYQALGLASLALAFSFVANNPGHITKKNNNPIYEFNTATNTGSKKEEYDVKFDIGLSRADQHLTITQKKLIYKTKNLLPINFGEEIILTSPQDIERYNEYLKMILIKLDPSLKLKNNIQKLKKIKISISKFISALQEQVLNKHNMVPNNTTPQTIYSELVEIFSSDKVTSSDWISTGQNSELIRHKLIYVLKNRNILKRNGVNRDAILSLIFKYIALDTQINRNRLEMLGNTSRHLNPKGPNLPKDGSSRILELLRN